MTHGHCPLCGVALADVAHFLCTCCKTRDLFGLWFSRVHSTTVELSWPTLRHNLFAGRLEPDDTELAYGASRILFVGSVFKMVASYILHREANLRSIDDYINDACEIALPSGDVAAVVLPSE